MKDIYVRPVKFHDRRTRCWRQGAAVFATVADTSFGPMLDTVTVFHSVDKWDKLFVLPGYALCPASYDRVCNAIGIEP